MNDLTIPKAERKVEVIQRNARFVFAITLVLFALVLVQRLSILIDDYVWQHQLQESEVVIDAHLAIAKEVNRLHSAYRTGAPLSYQDARGLLPQSNHFMEQAIAIAAPEQQASLRSVWENYKQLRADLLSCEHNPQCSFDYSAWINAHRVLVVHFEHALQLLYYHSSVASHDESLMRLQTLLMNWDFYIRETMVHIRIFQETSDESVLPYLASYSMMANNKTYALLKSLELMRLDEGLKQEITGLIQDFQTLNADYIHPILTDRVAVMTEVPFRESRGLPFIIKFERLQKQIYHDMLNDGRSLLEYAIINFVVLYILLIFFIYFLSLFINRIRQEALIPREFNH